jgi:hypothetical protein
MTARDDLKAAELTLIAIERDGRGACDRVPAEQPLSWDRSITLTQEQRDAPGFVSIARRAWRAGRGYLIPWLWDRYSDGRSEAAAWAATGELRARAVAAEAPARPADAPATADWMTEFERGKDD